MPIVSFDAMRQAFFRDAKAAYGDIMFWSRPGTWKLQCLTSNTSVRYVLSFINTKGTGPLVFEVPPTGDAAPFARVPSSATVLQRRARFDEPNQKSGARPLPRSRW
jgi:hypothetical protein